MAVLLAGLLGGRAGWGSTEIGVTFRGAGGASLAGTLALPAQGAGGRSPALVLIAGSGPTDRDGNQPPYLLTDLLKQIALALAAHGVATLRYDKRGMYANEDDQPKDTSQYADYFSWENFVADAAAAYRFLARRPDIDAARVGLLGHSEGGIVAALAAEQLPAAAHPPAVLILVSTPGRHADALIHDQLVAVLQRQRATAKDTGSYLEAEARITQAIRDTGGVPKDVPKGLASLYPPYLGKFLRSLFAADPAQAAARFRGPVLILAGAGDVQVSPEKDAAALDAALKGRHPDDHELFIVPGASHYLKPVKETPGPGIAGDLVPAALDKLVAWTTAQLTRPAAARSQAATGRRHLARGAARPVN
ncbi:MAG TPA: alpha/beta fold hydrolase [Thermoanaerobaculia bacterium]|nr:alpha/beta fold hydrolase [Thermoanaerobaculia bacterium]